MSEKIFLRVPSKVEHSYVSQGNLSVELEPSTVVTVTDRRFADWLVREYALAEVDKPAAKKAAKKKAPAVTPKATEKPTTTAPSEPAAGVEKTEGGSN